MRHFAVLCIIATLFARDDTIVKYYLAPDEPNTIFGNEIDANELEGKSYFKITYSSEGTINNIEYIESQRGVIGNDSLKIFESNRETTVERKPFIPLSPEQQAEMNPSNQIIQHAAYWNRRSPPVTLQNVEIEFVEQAENMVEDEKKTDKQVDDFPPDTNSIDSTAQIVDDTPKEIIAIITEEAAEVDSDSMVVKEKKRQRLTVSKTRDKKYYKNWNVVRGTLRKPIPHKNAISNFFEAAFDSLGFLKSVTEYRIRSRPVKTTTFMRDSTGLYNMFKETYHINTTMLQNNPHLYSDKASELRPDWWALYTLDEHHRHVITVTVFDSFGIQMYHYSFHYDTTPLAGLRNDDRAITVKYFSAEDSLLGWHQLFYREKNNLYRIDYYDYHNALQQSKEFTYNPEQKELLITLRNEKGKIIDRRLKPVL